MSDIRIILADDHDLVRSGIRRVLEGFEGVEVVAEASDGRQVLKLIKQHRPELALLDIAMPRLNGLDAAAQIARDFPAVRTIILSMHAEEEYVLKALRCGAAGYVLKESKPPELELAVRAVADGETYLTPRVSRHVIDDLRRRTESDEEADVLTLRQRETLQLIAEGCTSKQAAEAMGVSEKTVESHRSQIMARLGIHDLPGLVRYAIRVGLVSAET